MKTFAGRKLGRKPGHREMLLRNLTVSLFQNEKIETTVPKAKELRRYAEKIITSAKPADLNARRKVAKSIKEKEVYKKIFDVLAPRYQDRNGGYTQVLRTATRLGDAAPMAIVRLIP